MAGISIAVEGISLTVQKLSRKSFSAALIPFTLGHTNLGKKRPGSKVNLEADMIAKYVKRAVQDRENKSSLTVDRLREQGF